MARKQERPGNRSRLDHRKMVKMFDRKTTEFIANIRWGRRGQVFIEPAKNVQVKVVKDPEA